MSWKPYLRCQKCRDLKSRDEFPDKAGNATGKRGVCAECDPPPAPKKPEPVIPDRVRRAMCGKKRRYGRVYKCPICKGWHMTHKGAKAS